MPRSADPTICRDAAREAADRIRTILTLLNSDDLTSRILHEANKVIEEKCQTEGQPNMAKTYVDDMRELRRRMFN